MPYFVLLLAAQPGGARATDIATELHLDPSSLSGHVDRLAASGLIDRRLDMADRRVHRIALTARGAALVTELDPLGHVMRALEPGSAVAAPATVPRLDRRVAVPRPRPGATIVLRAATLTAPRSTVGTTLTRFAELVAQRTGGTIRVELDLPSTAPGGELQTLVDVRSGDVAIAAITLPVAGTLMPSAQLVELPYLLDDEAHAQAFLHGPFAARICAETERFELAALGLIGNGFRSLTSRDRVVRDPEDLAGLRLRVQQSPINVHLAEALAAVAVPIPFPRLPDALAAGDVDAQENALANIVGLELWRWQRELTLSRHAYSAHLVLANAEILASLGSGAAIVCEAMRDAIAEGHAAAPKLESAFEAELGARMRVTLLDVAARERFIDATRLVRARVARALGDAAVADVLAAAGAARAFHHSATA
jgi:TRAP-type C4-dicarboxylate transport system substrate-binding protein